MPKNPTTEEQQQFSLYGKPLPYLVKRSDRRTLQISIHPDQNIVVHAPHKTSLADIHNILTKRAYWIDKTLRQLEKLPPSLGSRQWISGETHRYLGRQYRLDINQGKIKSIKLKNGFFQITVPDTNDKKMIESLMQQWYKEHAISIFEEHLQKCIHQSKSILELSQVTITLKIRPMKSRWGSCNNKGTINLNLELIKASIDCIDYVIMHELCHLKEMNHSKKFWQLLSQSMPDWESRKAKLSKLEIL